MGEKFLRRRWRVEDGALSALGHLVMSSIVISLRRARRVIRCVGGRALAGLGISGCVLVPVGCSSCRTVLGFSPLGGHVVDDVTERA